MGSHESAEAAYWSFFERFNAKDAEGGAAAMSYPHVRVSASAPPSRGGRFDPRTASFLTPTPADYASMATERGWERFEATGWVRTQGIEPRRVQENDDKVHLAGGWTRFRADDSPIISNRVLYVLTRLEQGWGIQARFGVDSFVEDADRSAQEQQALAALALTMTTLEAGDVEPWLACFHYPLTIVAAPGAVQTLADADAMRTAFGDWAGEALPIQYEAHVIASGETGVTLAQSITRGGDSFQQAFLIAQGEDGWKTLAVTAVS